MSKLLNIFNYLIRIAVMVESAITNLKTMPAHALQAMKTTIVGITLTSVLPLNAQTTQRALIKLQPMNANVKPDTRVVIVNTKSTNAC